MLTRQGRGRVTHNAGGSPALHCRAGRLCTDAASSAATRADQRCGARRILADIRLLAVDGRHAATRRPWTCNHERPNMALGGITPTTWALAARLHSRHLQKTGGLPFHVACLGTEIPRPAGSVLEGTRHPGEAHGTRPGYRWAKDGLHAVGRSPGRGASRLRNGFRWSCYSRVNCNKRKRDGREQTIDCVKSWLTLEWAFPDAGWSSLAARRAHNPKVAGSNPAPATRLGWKDGPFRCRGHGRSAQVALRKDAGRRVQDQKPAT